MLRSVIVGALAAITAASVVEAQPTPGASPQGQRQRLTASITSNGCDAESYSLTVSPEGNSLSILFDNFVVTGGQEVGKRCALTIPLNLPEGYSLGVYQVDYRGYAKLPQGQAALFNVDYVVGRAGNGRGMRHRLRGPQDGDFSFTDQLRPGMLRRIGCGEAAKLDFNAVLAFRRDESTEEAMLSLDSADGTRSPANVTFKFDLQPCRQAGARRK